jgi:uncharacterized Tic20 family protein
MDTTETTTTLPTQDERILAALSHVTVLFPFMGTISPIIIWATQKDKSPYIRFQALQALAYQIVLILVWFGGMACYMCSFFGSFFGMMPFIGGGEGANPTAGVIFGLTFIIPFLVFGAMFASLFLFIIYGIIGAVMVLQGKDFRYAIIGRRLERYLQAK